MYFSLVESDMHVCKVYVIKNYTDDCSLFRFPLALLRRIGRLFHSCTTLRTRWMVWTWWTSLGWMTETRASLDWLTSSSLWHRSLSLWWTTGTVTTANNTVPMYCKICTLFSFESVYQSSRSKQLIC